MAVSPADQQARRRRLLAASLERLGLKRPAERAAALLAEFGSLARLSQATEDELRRSFADHPTAAAALLCARELVWAGMREDAFAVPLDPVTPELGAYLVERMSRHCEEVLIGLFANRDRRLIAESELALGNGRAVAVPARAVLRKAIAVGADALLLVHNHPSGHARPSLLDRVSTRRLRARAGLVGVDLIDHIIVSGATLYSMRAGRAL